MASVLAQIEALLFVSGEDGLTLAQLAEFLHLPPTGLQQSLDKLKEQYEQNPDTALSLIESSRHYKIVTKESFADLLTDYSDSPINQSLSRASMEVLSIIAYKQPITRVEVDEIRGVNSSSAIAKLQAYGLVKEAGKLETIGRPNLYATTDYFLDFMGINSIEELLDASTIKAEDETLTLFADEEGNQEENEN